MNLKKITLLVLLFSITMAVLAAQQITRFAVVDTSRIYTTFYRDSRNVRDYEAKRTQYRAEIERLGNEIKNLRQAKVDAEAAGDQTRAQRLDAEIQTKTAFLVEYSRAKNTELDTLKQRLTTDDQFYSMLYDEIRRIGESEGYSMVLSMQEGSSIFWYSPTVDITDKVIRNLTSRQ